MYAGQEIGATEKLPVTGRKPIEWEKADQEMKDFYSWLFNLRRENEVFHTSLYHIMESDNPDIFATVRVKGKERVITAINFSYDRTKQWARLTLPLDMLKIKRESEATYKLRDLSTGEEFIYSGKELSDGLVVGLKGCDYHIFTLTETERGPPAVAKMGELTPEQRYFQQGYKVGATMKLEPVHKDIIKKLQKVENLTLRYNEGKDILYDLNVPGLHLLLVAYQYIKFTGERGQWTLWHHSFHNDFFTKVYDILNKAGLTEEILPEAWKELRELKREADALKDARAKANINIQLFGFIQGLLENILYQQYIARGNKAIEDALFKKLLVAADSFVARDEEGGVKILAGYPWFDQSWGRDTFISLPGLLLTTGRYEDAKAVFRYYAKYQRADGIIPNRIFLDGKVHYNTADGSLWFVDALYRYYQTTRDTEFMEEMLPVVNKILDCYTSPQGDVYLDEDNLVVVPAQWTWMDADPEGKGHPVTPRNGKPVEIQGMFYNALGIAAELNLYFGNTERAEELNRAREEIERERRVWEKERRQREKELAAQEEEITKKKEDLLKKEQELHEFYRQKYREMARKLREMKGKENP